MDLQARIELGVKLMMELSYTEEQARPWVELVLGEDY